MGNDVAIKRKYATRALEAGPWGAAVKVSTILFGGLVLLSGCADVPVNESSVSKEPTFSPLPSPSPVPAPLPAPWAPNGSIDLFSLRPRLVDCQNFVISTNALREDVGPYLPSGYTPQGLYTEEVVDILLDQFKCGSFILDNETVIPSVSMLTTQARVRVNETLKRDAQVHFYLLEFFVSDATVAQLFRELGFKVVPAEISLSESSGVVESTVARDGRSIYQTTALNGVGDAPERTLDMRSHQVGEGGRVLWFDQNQTYTLPAKAGEALIKVEGGVLQAIRPGDQGMTRGTASLGPSWGELEFGRLG